MKKLKKFLAMSLVAVLGTSVLAGCSSEGNENGAGDNGGNEEKTTVQIAFVNWAEGVAMTNLAKVVLEDKLDYKVETTMADAGVIYTSLADGDTDMFLDAWLPVTHKDYMDEHGDNLTNLGVNFENARIGTVVPSYVEINSLEEMNSVKDKFDGKIIGIDAGAGVMQATERAIDEYGLDYELMTGSGPVMTASLGDAIDNNEWVAVTGWTPHWKFAKWDLKFLDDPKKAYGETETIYTIARKDIEEDEAMSKAVEYIKNFKMDDSQLGDLMAAIAEGDNEEESARAWMKENEDLVNSWLPAE